MEGNPLRAELANVRTTAEDMSARVCIFSDSSSILVGERPSQAERGERYKVPKSVPDAYLREVTNWDLEYSANPVRERKKATRVPTCVDALSPLQLYHQMPMVGGYDFFTAIDCLILQT